MILIINFKRLSINTVNLFNYIDFDDSFFAIIDQGYSFTLFCVNPFECIIRHDKHNNSSKNDNNQTQYIPQLSLSRQRGIYPKKKQWCQVLIT